MTRHTAAAVVIGLVVVSTSCGVSSKMNFFITSGPTGDGGNLGGLAGADAHCNALAGAVGSKRQWHAYLSVSASADGPAVNARDRIGKGPWYNSQGQRVAVSLDELHGAGNKLGGRVSLDERGHLIPNNVHDILTGSNADGTLADGDSTCHNWTSTEGRAMVGHSNKVGGIGGERARSWNSAHLSEGCTMPALQKLGSGALLYCFAIE